MTVSRLTSVLLPLLLCACTFGVPIGERGAQQGKPTSAKSSRGNPPSYVVHGKRYYVMDSSEGFVQRGIASWYGRKFHGRKTSSGEVYNMHDMTAAHKTLPIPVYVHVRNLDNGRTAIVRVNDRGPFIDGRIIDLSYAAATRLGVDGPGTANVEISVIERGQTQPTSVVRAVPLATPESRDQPLYIQMGSFASLNNADNLVRTLLAANESAAQVSPLQTDDGLFYRVRVGPLFDIDEANAILARLRGKGFESIRIVVED
ncbi:MAG TPA: septal ring lytic transglycosylase RlpA family protein [Gammaproteobacteria bacterium]|jgi:rare lipoprotein A